MNTETPVNPVPPGRRRRLVLLVLVPLVALVAGVLFWLYGGRYVETENAYLKATKTPLSAEVSGPVAEVLVRENAAVAAGQLLLRLDPAPFRVAVDRARAERDAVATELAALQAEYREIQARTALARADLDYALRQRRRLLDLAGKHFASEAQLDEVKHGVTTARQRIAALGQELERVTAALGGDASLPVDHHPRLRAARAAVARAELDLQHTQIRAPMAGRVSKVPDPGEYLKAGNVALLLVADRDLWVEANFIESDLTHVRAGQPAVVRVDTFPGVEWRAVVESLSPASGAEFAILPPQNATGNWVKIVQRVPVRVRLQEAEQDLPLRAGLSAWVEIDTGHRRELLGLRWPAATGDPMVAGHSGG
jgi:membrane fusion protein (multidrug efflux system)